MSSVNDWAASNPIKENRSGLIGKPVDRYEGPLKVTGTARYSAEVETPSPALYGVMVPATIARGRITAIDLDAARAAPGVQLVWTHQNVPEQGKRERRIQLFSTLPDPALDSDRVRYFGEPVAFVVADSLENAQAAAGLVRLDYAAEPAETDFAALADTAAPPSIPTDPKAQLVLRDHPSEDHGAPGPEGNSRVGDFEQAFAAAPVKVDDVWTTPVQNHCQMEPHAAVAWWEGERLILNASVQLFFLIKSNLAATLMIDPENIRILTRYVGGGFGAKGFAHQDIPLAALAARQLGRPVKVVFTRQHMFHGTMHRAATRMHVRLGAERDGRLTALSLIGVSHWDRDGFFLETPADFARNLYAAPNRLTGNRVVELDLPKAGPMRAPGEATGTMALEPAMDEMAEKLGLDPIEFRIRNEPQFHPETGIAFSQRPLVRCMKEGAQRFGWDRRNPTPGAVREGPWMIGMGMATAIRGSTVLAAQCSMSVDAEGVITVRQGMTDIGTGSYTVLAQIAAEIMGVRLEDVRVEIGDSDLPPAPGSGGQFGAASAGSAALSAGMNLRKAVADLAVDDPASPLHGGDAASVVFRDGVLAIDNRSETLHALISRTSPQGLERLGEFAPPSDLANWSIQTFGAHFAEVGVDVVTGEVRMRRMLGVFDAGRILNRKTARSQLTGGMIWGVSSALTEGNAVDTRYGSFIAQDLGNYLVPVQADIGELDAFMLDEEDDKANPLGIKGIGELGLSGSGAAIANAVYNACGVRVRDFPITPEKILAGLP